MSTIDEPGVEIAFVSSHAPQIFLERQDSPEVLAATQEGMRRMGRRIVSHTAMQAASHEARITSGSRCGAEPPLHRRSESCRSADAAISVDATFSSRRKCAHIEFQRRKGLERAKGFEPSTSTMATWRSTAELRPHQSCDREPRTRRVLDRRSFDDM